MRFRWCFPLLCGALLAACGPSAETVTVLGCRDDMDCPGGSTCLPSDGGLRCVLVLDASLPPAGSPALELSAAALDFGSPLPGAATTVELVLTSTGDAPLAVHAVTLIEDDARAEFSVSAAGVPATLAPGESTTVAVTLIPADAEEDRGYLLVASNDPAHAAVLVPLTSWVKGVPALEACVDAAAPPSTCADPASFAFGTVDYGASATRVARLRNVNAGNAVLTVTGIAVPEPPAVPASLFTFDLFTLEGGVESPATLPFLIGPQQSTPDLYLRLRFQADIDRALPSMFVAVATAGTATPASAIPIEWAVNGCPDGYRDLHAEIPGCEYACPVWPTRGEACDGVDDDCDGVADNGFDLTSDEENCGFCGHRCELAHASSGCENSICKIVECDRDANGGYANVNGDHGDGCEYECPVWPTTAEACNGQDDDCDQLVDEDFPLQSDPHNCGECNVDCLEQGLVCSAGHCLLTCPPGTTNCSGACVDLDTDPRYCGSCTTSCAFDHAAATCIERTCVMGACDGGFANLDRNDQNGCEHPCAVWPPVLEACNNTDDDCDGQADETFDKQNDPVNCGTCGHACSFPHAQALCVAGHCVMGACADGYRDLANGSADGCEYQCPTWPPVAEACNGADDNCDGRVDETFDTQNDPQNCNTCGHQCSFLHAQALCVVGQCVMGVCADGYRDLANGSADGCEYHCPVWPPVAEACNGADDNCDGRVDETFDKQNDPLNCNACGHTCSFPNAQALCVAGVCRLGACADGYRDLAGGDADGCEYHCPVWPPQDETCNDRDDDCDGLEDETFDFINDPANCGSCGHSCALDGTQVACVNRSCTIVGCLASYYDLNGGADGCEYHCPTNPPAVEVCNNRDDDCDGLIDEGFDKLTDHDNCGVCGNQCGANQICCAGGCVDSNELNCGTCGHACGASVTCFQGTCVAPGVVIVTEMMIDTKAVAEDKGEWIEVFNTTSYPINLAGWVLRDDGTNHHVIVDDVWVAPGGFAVLGVDADYAINGGVAVDYCYQLGSFLLSNSEDEVVLEVPLATPLVIDRVDYVSGWTITEGHSTQLDPDKFDPVSNNNKANWCATATHRLPLPPTTSDYGTPGAANEQCP